MKYTVRIAPASLLAMAAVPLQSPPSILCSRRSFSCFRPPSVRQHLSNRVRSSAEAGSDTVVEKDPASPPSEESPVGTQRRPSSLISAANVQKAIRGLAITDADHYGRIGIARNSSYDQVKVAYENKCEELMNKGLDEAEKMKELELLKESYEILSSEEERRLYDWSLVRSEKPDRYVWPFEVDRVKPPTEPPPAQEPEDVGPTRLVGYFLLAWLILSVVLSVAIYI